EVLRDVELVDDLVRDAEVREELERERRQDEVTEGDAEHEENRREGGREPQALLLTRIEPRLDELPELVDDDRRAEDQPDGEDRPPVREELPRDVPVLQRDVDGIDAEGPV